MRRALQAVLLTVVFNTAAMADSLELRLNNEVAELTYASGGHAMGASQGDVTVGFLFNTDSDKVATLGFQSLGQMDQHTMFALGFKTYAVRIAEPRETVFAGAVGGGAGYTIPDSPVTFSASAFFAPEILTSDAASRVWELGARVQVQLLPNAAVFIGWRDLRAHMVEAGGDYKIDHRGHVGLKLGF